MGSVPKRPTTELNSHVGSVNVLRHSKDGGYCLSGGMDRAIKLWNPLQTQEENRLIQTFKGHGWEVADVNLSQDSTRFVSGGGDRSVFLWDVATCQVARKFSGHTQKINTVDFNEDGSVIASGSHDTTVRLWDCRSQSRLPIQILEDAKDGISSIKIVGCEILIGSIDSKVRLYDLRMGQLQTDSMPAPVTSVSFTKDGHCILVSSLDNTVRLMDKDNGNMLNHFSAHRNSNYRISSVTTHDDALVVTGSEDGYVYVYELMEGKLVGRLPIHHKTAISVSAHPSTNQVLVGGSDGKITVWDL